MRQVLSPAGSTSSICKEVACNTPETNVEVEAQDEAAPVEKDTFPEKLMPTTPTSSKVAISHCPKCQDLKKEIRKLQKKCSRYKKQVERLVSGLEVFVNWMFSDLIFHTNH